MAVQSVRDAAVSIEDKGDNVEQEDDPAPKGGAHGSVPGGAGLQALPKLHVYGDRLAPLLLFFCLGCLVGACSKNFCEVTAAESGMCVQHPHSPEEYQGALQTFSSLAACMCQSSF